MERKIKIIVSERETKDGRKFNVYKAVTKNGRLMDAKFRKDVSKVPEETSYVHVLEGNMNIDRKREYPVLWISEVEEITTIKEEHDEQDKKVINEYFD